MSFEFLLPSILGSIFFIVVGYLLSRILKRNDIADVMWGLGFVVVAVLSATKVDVLSFRAKLMLALTVLWALRLTTYIGLRTLKKSEDVRYANWRREWARTEPWRAFLQVFTLQGLILGFISLPVLFGIRQESSVLTAFDFLGLGLFLIGFIFESVADHQMSQFKSDPANKAKVLKSGLWSLTRHPNYFGETLIWWGLFLIAFNVSGGWLTLISPLLITYLLQKVSGIPMLEKVMQQRGEEFRIYVQQTPQFFPFRMRELLTFLVIALSLFCMDSVWLGFIMRDFYRDQLRSLVVEDWTSQAWAVIGVYLCLALGLQFFAVNSSPSKIQAAFRGAIFGLVSYGLYDFTNLALVKNWPSEMAFVDIIWGVVLCVCGAALGWMSKSKLA